MFKWVESVDVGQFYGEISVIFFLSFRLKTAAFSLPFGVFVSTSREEEKEKEKKKEKEKEKLLYLYLKNNFFSFPLHFLARAFARICARI